MASHPFTPPQLPPKLDYSSIQEDITQAHIAVARYDEAVTNLPNPKLIQRQLINTEAVQSSRIEGTQIDVEEVLEHDAEEVDTEETEKEQDYKEVKNYRQALLEGERLLQSEPLTENVIKKLHEILLSSVRGQNRKPGRLRVQKAFIGAPGSNAEKARYVPPLPDRIPELFSNLVTYINKDQKEDVLVQAAIMHYQFEAIHPFMDGNGRVGRILVPLFLYMGDTTAYPNVYISEFLESNRQDYYDLLKGVSSNGDWLSWITFFLRAVKTQSKRSLQTTKEVQDLYDRLVGNADQFNSKYAVPFINALFEYPVFRTAQIKEQAGIKNNQTLYNLIEKFVDAGVIKDMTPSKQRHKRYAFTDLIKIIAN